MLQMLHSELDADRIDYLLRDAAFSGASYGTFDLGILLQNLDGDSQVLFNFRQLSSNVKLRVL